MECEAVVAGRAGSETNWARLYARLFGEKGWEEQIVVQWKHRSDGAWIPLSSIDPADEVACAEEGVYLIWHGGSASRTICVGHGKVRDRLAALRRDPAVQSFRSQGIYVSWARVAADQQAGVAAYLEGVLAPILKHDNDEGRALIPVNLP